MSFVVGHPVSTSLTSVFDYIPYAVLVTQITAKILDNFLKRW